MSPTTTVYFGPAINPVSLTEYSALPNCLIAVSSHGIIDWLEKDVDATNLQNILLKHGYEPDSVVELLPGQFLMPGLIDTHIVRLPLHPPTYFFVNVSDAACPSSSEHWNVSIWKSRS